MKKIIVIGIIALFVGVGFQSAFALDNRLSINNIEIKEDFNGQEESINNFPMINDMLTELKTLINNILLRFGHIPEVKEKCEELLDVINEVRPLCLVVELILINLFALIFIFAASALDSGEGTIMYYIYTGITLIFISSFKRWEVIFEDVLECGEF